VLKSFFQSIKLFFVPEKEFYGLFELLGFYPDRTDLYELAFIHKSASIYKDGIHLNNERLEYLGDAILGAVIADILYKYFPNKDEGFLTQTRSKIVSREFLNNLADRIGLQKHVVSNVNLSCNKHIFGDAFEALIGAIYLDQGYYKTKLFVENEVFRKYIDLETVVTVDKNYKSKLIEWAQKMKYEIEFDTREMGLDRNSKTLQFISEISLDKELLGRGIGSSKKEAQQKAASEALVNIKKRGWD
jgi:ribonuclease-3